MMPTACCSSSYESACSTYSTGDPKSWPGSGIDHEGEDAGNAEQSREELLHDLHLRTVALVVGLSLMKMKPLVTRPAPPNPTPVAVKIPATSGTAWIIASTWRT